MVKQAPRYKRILLKLSGEALAGDKGFGINHDTIERIAEEIKSIHQLGTEIAIVVGGGNIFRGIAGTAQGMDRAASDYMGMLATVMNALALQDAMRIAGLRARVQSALNIEQVAEPYIRGKAIRYLEDGRIVVRVHSAIAFKDILALPRRIARCRLGVLLDAMLHSQPI